MMPIDDTPRPPSGPDPADFHLMIQALADGELDAATALSVERRLATDPVLAAEYDRILALKQALGALPRPKPTPALEARIAALAGPPPARPLPAFGWRALAASILLSALVAGGGTYLVARREPAPGGTLTVAEMIAMDHRRALLAASPVDIASSDQHQVKPWLDRKLGVSPPTVDLAAEGFPLLGARVEVVAGQPVPALVYRRRDHLITVVSIPRTPGSRPVPTVERQVADGLAMQHWTDDVFAYWAVSDVNPADLEHFIALFRAAAGPG
jgi:anti-sigma factor RsiW